MMPNTPCLVGETAAAMCLGGKVSQGGRGWRFGTVPQAATVVRL